MKVLCLVVVALAAVVSMVSASCHTCDASFKGFGTEPGKCGCCPWPCCCKCVETESCTPPTTTPSPTTTTAECPCLDLVFVVDASGSIGTFDWSVTLGFLSDIVDVMNAETAGNLCQDNINVAVVAFSNNATVEIDLTSSDSVIIDTSTVNQEAQLTNIVEGIELALEVIENSKCNSFLVILTDGRSNFRVDDIPAIGQQLQENTDDAVCIGITNKIDAAQLEDICPQADRRMSVNDFDDLIKLMAEQVAEMMNGMITTAEVPVVTEAPECNKSEECFCCCSPEQFWGGYRR